MDDDMSLLDIFMEYQMVARVATSLMVVVTFPPFFRRKLLLSLVDFFINQVLEYYSRFIALHSFFPLDYFCDTRWSFVRDKIRILRYTPAIIEL